MYTWNLILHGRWLPNSNFSWWTRGWGEVRGCPKNHQNLKTEQKILILSFDLCTTSVLKRTTMYFCFQARQKVSNTFGDHIWSICVLQTIRLCTFEQNSQSSTKSWIWWFETFCGVPNSLVEPPRIMSECSHRVNILSKPLRIKFDYNYWGRIDTTLGRVPENPPRKVWFETFCGVSNSLAESLRIISECNHPVKHLL